MTGQNDTGTLVPPVPDRRPGGGTDNPSLHVPVSRSPSPEPENEVVERIGRLAASIEEGGSSLANALWEVFRSPNVRDSNWEAANVVDALAMIARAIDGLAQAVEGFREEKPRATENRGMSRIPDELRAPRRRSAAR